MVAAAVAQADSSAMLPAIQKLMITKLVIKTYQVLVVIQVVMGFILLIILAGEFMPRLTNIRVTTAE